MKTLVCIKCGIEKNVSEYFESKKWKSGYNSVCKDCVRERQRLYIQRKKNEKLKLEPEGVNDNLNKNTIRMIMNDISTKYNNKGMRNSKPISVISFYYDKIPNNKIIKKDLSLIYRLRIKSDKSLIDITDIDIEKYEDEYMYKYEYSMWY